LIFSFSEVDFWLQGTAGPIPLSVTIGEEVPSIVLGDCNEDGAVTSADVPAMIGILSSGRYLVQADCNEDGSADFRDIPEFIEILRGQ